MSTQKQILLEMVTSMNDDDALKALEVLKQVFIVSARKKTWDDIETVEADEDAVQLMKKIKNKEDGYGEYL